MEKHPIRHLLCGGWLDTMLQTCVGAQSRGHQQARSKVPLGRWRLNMSWSDMPTHQDLVLVGGSGDRIAGRSTAGSSSMGSGDGVNGVRPGGSGSRRGDARPGRRGRKARGGPGVGRLQEPVPSPERGPLNGSSPHAPGQFSAGAARPRRRLRLVVPARRRAARADEGGRAGVAAPSGHGRARLIAGSRQGSAARDGRRPGGVLGARDPRWGAGRDRPGARGPGGVGPDHRLESQDSSPTHSNSTRERRRRSVAGARDHHRPHTPGRRAEPTS